MTLATTLEPISPEDATEWYLDHRGQEVTHDTVECKRTSLGYFVENCESHDIEDRNDPTGRDGGC